MGIQLGGFLETGALFRTSQSTVLVGYGLKPATSSDHGATSIYAPDFFLSANQPWLHFDHVEEMPCAELQDLLAGVTRKPWDVIREQPPSRGAFHKAFCEIQAGFRNGLWRKVVPVAFSRFVARTSPEVISYALDKLLRLPDPLVPYGFWTPRGGMLGASPERLFRTEGRCLQTMALAGTRAVGTASGTLLEDQKQLVEHRIVVDDLREVLGAIGDVELGRTHELFLPTLVHLCTRIRLHMRQVVSFEHLTRRMHPTPALGSSPRGAADTFFRRMDQDCARGRFGAPFGWRGVDGDGECVVAIRNIQWHDDDILLGGGCGIVPASRFDDEWEELLAKHRAVRETLGL